MTMELKTRLSTYNISFYYEVYFSTIVLQKYEPFYET